MSKFDRLSNGNRQQEDLVFLDMEGVFSCNTCEEVVYEAKYDPGTGILGWKCSSGHKTFNEGLKI